MLIDLLSYTSIKLLNFFECVIMKWIFIEFLPSLQYYFPGGISGTLAGPDPGVKVENLNGKSGLQSLDLLQTDLRI